MRFLFTTNPTIGHFHALVPLARAARDAGHEVAFATGRSFGSIVARAGFQHFPAGLDFDGSYDVLPTLPEWEEIDRKPLPLPFKQAYGFVQGLGPRMADDLVGLVRAWKPAVIVRDPLEFGAYVAAEACGVPHASVMWAMYIDPKFVCPDALHALRQRYGLPDDPCLDTYDRHLVLKLSPLSWAMPGVPIPPVAHGFCAPPFDQSVSTELPGWVRDLPDRPTVYATLGTSFNRAPGVFRAIIDALGAEDVNGIVTVGRTLDPGQFQPLPDGVRVEQYVPQSLLLPRCDAMIFHGGYNSLLSAMWNALPVIVIPQEGGDQVPTAHMCAALGLGAFVPGNPPAPEAIRAALQAVLSEPRYRARVEQARQEMMALPPLSEAVKRLEALGETGQPGRLLDQARCVLQLD